MKNTKIIASSRNKTLIFDTIKECRDWFKCSELKVKNALKLDYPISHEGENYQLDYLLEE